MPRGIQPRHAVPAGAFTLALASIGACAPAQADPQWATTVKSVHLRAGPARDYPVVMVLPPGQDVQVQGCLSRYTWCDVVAGPSRGWVYAPNLSFMVENRVVPLPDYGAALGIGIIGFILGDYWGNHYRDRPWYGEAPRWAPRTPPPGRWQPVPPNPPSPHPPPQGRPPGGERHLPRPPEGERQPSRPPAPAPGSRPPGTPQRPGQGHDRGEPGGPQKPQDGAERPRR
jgi:hypothetical protein